MKSTKKVTLLLLTSALVLGACGSPAKDVNPAATGSTPAGTTTSTPEVKKEKLKLNWFVNALNANALLPSVDKDFVKKAIDEKFNVDLKLDYGVIGSDYTNKINLKMSAREYSDLFVTSGIDSVKYISDGVARDISTLVTEKTMPNYFKNWVTTEELKLFQTSGAFARAPIPYAKSRYVSYYVRQDWLDKLNLKVPQTYDEMVKVMTAFVENDPDGNGKKDTIGMTAAGNGTSISRDFPEFFEAGLMGGSLFLEGDQVIDSQSDIRNEKALAGIKKNMEAGLYDPNWFLNKAGNRDDKIIQGKVGIIYSLAREAALDNHPNSYQKRTKDVTGASVNWQPFHPWKEWAGVESTSSTAFIFPTGVPEENVKRSIEILDWLASKEGYLLTRYGLEGVHYKKSGDTIEVITEAYKKDITDNGDFLSIYNFFAPDDPVTAGLKIINPQETDRDRKILEHLQSYKYKGGIGTAVTLKAGMDLATMRSKLNELLAKIIFEEKDTSNWPKYRQEVMNKYGGGPIFQLYAEQISTAHGKKFIFKAD